MTIEAITSSLVSGATSVANTKSTGTATGSSNDFTTVLGQMLESTANSLNAAENTSIAGIKGQATTQQVVESVLSAERSLQTAIAVRDKAVSAYLELSRMSI